MKRILFSLFIGMALFVLNAGNTWAQATAQIAGTVKDQTGAVLPGVEVTATQTDTGISRMSVTNETGLYVLANLPIGTYRLTAGLPGFKTYAQAGIVLDVNASPAINPVLEVGQVAEQVEVQANAALVDTRTSGVGQVMENTRILDLPLNGRAMIDLVSLSGAATPALILDGSGGRDPFTKGNVSVAGGLNTGLNTTLDGAYHNNPYTNGYMSMPFPDALQEFKIETGATGAQNGLKSSGTLSLVTKSGTNEIHGNAFEFVRNGMFNARNAFATKRDTIKRNQFGGTVGGPIEKNKLFFFAGYQGTLFRQDPADTIGFVPTAAMLAGDFTAEASPACNSGRQITLKGPFVNNRVDPKLFSQPAVLLSGKLPSSSDPCGKTIFGMPRPENDNTLITRIDYQRSANHSIFGRYLLDTATVTAPFNVTHVLLSNPTSAATGNHGRDQGLTLGDTYLIGTNIVNAFRFTANRIFAGKFSPNYDNAGAGPADIGIKAYAYEPHNPTYSITGAFSTGYNGAGPSSMAIFAVNDDISIVHGNHQLAFGGQVADWQVNSYSDQLTKMAFTFNGQTTGLGMADFLTGNASGLTYGTNSDQNKGQHYFSLYGNDSWKLNQRLTFNYGLRWEPFFPMVNYDGSAINFNFDGFVKGTKTARFANAPPGVSFNGDPGFPGLAGMNRQWKNLSPRVGLAWDVSGDGKTSVRASVGTFYDFASAQFYQGLTTGAPFTPRINRTNVNFATPWADYPGGDPFPLAHGRGTPTNSPWQLASPINDIDHSTPNMRVAQFNLSVQRQVGTDWLVSANYIGNGSRHLWSLQQVNPSLFLGLGPCNLNGIQYPTCSTTGNQEQRRLLALNYPQYGPLLGYISRIDSGGTANYNGMILSVQRRAARGVTVTANYTYSHCISDPWDASTNSGVGGTGWTDPFNRHASRGNCFSAASDRRQIVNISAVAETPRFSNSALRVAGSGWRFSPIVRILSGDYLSISTNQDRALNSITGQRVSQILGNPYGNGTVSNYLNPAAFALPAMGTLGNMGVASVRGPGYWQFDAALSRTFQLREAQKIEFRAEAFNVTNSFQMNDSVGGLDTTLNSNTFGQVLSSRDPRIMQFALKYFF